MFLDATYCKARVDRRVCPRPVFATGAAADGRREVLGFAVGDSEDGAFWTRVPRSLKVRGLAGVQLVIADAHLGLRAAVQAVLAGAAVQGCRVQLVHNVLARVPKGNAEMVPAAIRAVIAQPDATHVRPARRHRHDARPAVPDGRDAAARRRRRAARVRRLPRPALEEIWSPNPLDRLNREIKGRTDVVGVLPTRPRCSASPAPCSSKPTTSGKSGTATTCLKAQRPCSSRPCRNRRR